MAPRFAIRPLLMLLVVATAVAQTPADRSVRDDPPTARVGRAAPPWTGAVELRRGREPRPVDAAFERRLIGRGVLLVAPRVGDARDADVEAAAALLPPSPSSGPAREVVTFVAAVAADDTADPPEGVVLLRVPEVDKRYGAPSRPWVAVHDRRGILRAICPLQESATIRAALRDSIDEGAPNLRLVGTPMEPVADLAPRGLPSDEQRLPDLDALRAPPGGLALYRFWTDGCPHCKASLPALAGLAARFDGFRVVPVYHPKSRVRRSDDWLTAFLADLGHHGPWAGDPEWIVLKRLMARGELQTATSVSFLVDDRGIIRWVHPGPRLHPDPEGAHGSADRDFAALESIVARWCGAPVGAGR
jgi:thiol-disulfide isomerase/thioredoxin